MGMAGFSVKGKRVLVVGGARSGVAAAELLVSRGAQVTVADERKTLDAEAQLRRLRIDVELGAHDPDTFTNADLIVVSPGVPLRQPAIEAARAAGVQVLGEIELASRWIKGRIVARDERETTGYRTVLNFGHTLGHAIEAATQYRGRYTHGEAVAIGMRAATALAARLGLCAPSLNHTLGALLDAYALPRVARGVRPAAVLAALGHDKKIVAGRLRWVLPTRIGHVIVTPDVPAALVRAVVEEFVIA